MKHAVIILSGGIDSVCLAARMKPEYRLHGITFSYGQRALREVRVAKKFAKILGLKTHKVVDIGFMRELYDRTNVLTSPDRRIPGRFDYSIVVPIRNAVFLSIATAWAYTLGASTVAYGAHKGDASYPDCRPSFAKKIETAFNEGEKDGIKHGIRKAVRITSPYREGLTKSDLMRSAYRRLGSDIYKTWSCYSNGRYHCGVCESCNNRKHAFEQAGITDRTRYA